MVRPEIQALRAVAVLLVVVCHLWPSVLPGGFIGVDVFFAISGFLITSHLLREVDRTGRVSLPEFWARRARRILPAALVVLLFCAVATLLVVPQNHWQQFLGDLRASTAYVQNWHLASAAVDYFAAADAPSPVQHFWSLAAEEQFYLMWPVLILVAVALTWRGSARITRTSIAIVLAALTAASVAYSIYDTAANPAAAYFVTPTRAWEFGAGGLLALLKPVEGSHTALRSALCWAGIAAIGVAALTCTGATPFPGYVALLPVLGALAVMWAGAPARRWAPTPVLALPPVQFLGDVSYSVYLWHWPLLILAPFVIHRRLDTLTTLTVLAVTILAAWLTKLLIEDPVRSGPFLARRRARWTFACVAGGTAAVLAVTAAGSSSLQAQTRKAEQATKRVLAAKPKCFGAAARDPRHQPCVDPALRLTVAPSPIEARSQPNSFCTLIEREPLRVCAFGAARAGAARTIALVGDSHAAHWRAALDQVARRRAWRGLSLSWTSCPFSAATEILTEPASSRCLRWKQDVLRWFPQHPEVSTVFVSAITGGKGVVHPPGQANFDASVAGFLGAWNALPPTVKHIVVIRDTPKMQPDTSSCVQRAIAKRKPAGPACAESRRSALEPDAAAVAAAQQPQRVQVVDLTQYFCDRRRCYPVIGGALVLKDETHMTRVFSQTLGPFLAREVHRVAAAWR